MSPSVFSSSLFQPEADLDPEPVASTLTQRLRRSINDGDGMRAPSKFVRKLYGLLNDGTHPSVICWCSSGDAFVVKDLDKFTRSILPRTFMHSNFASFVRQLNEHNFCRVKSTDENTLEKDNWTFSHRSFHRNHRDALCNVRRHALDSTTRPTPESRTSLLQALQAQHACMRRQHADTTAHVQLMRRKIDKLLGSMAGLERMREEQEEVMRRLVRGSTSIQEEGNEEVAIFQ